VGARHVPTVSVTVDPVGAVTVPLVSQQIHDFNAKIIDEFRTNDGRVGGMFEGVPMLLLHTKGAKSGAPRINPLAYRPVGDVWAIFGSFGGAPVHPAWYFNLVAEPDAEIEVGNETVPVRARVLAGAERDEVWSAQKRDRSTFADYEAKTDREIPVVLLERR
jgi:deazaflavin-dependent oxidoreductase (nitroreductase family)